MDDLIATRTKLRAKATKLCNEFQAYRKIDRASIDSDQLALKLQHLKKVQGELQDVQVQLAKHGQTEESTHLQTVEDEVFLGTRVLGRLEEAEKAQVQGSTWNAELKSSVTVKIPVFHGDEMKWPEFWELFALSVHDNPSYANVQKFVVLKSHLAGAALRTIQGIPVTSDAYGQAITVLKDRFERDEERKEALMKELLNMPAVRGGDLKGMRSLIDHLSSHTRALETLGVPSSSFSSLLLPIVKNKIPEDWRLEWARLERSTFAEFIQFLNKEIRLRESAKGVATQASPDAHHLSPSVTSTLTTHREPYSVGSKSVPRPRLLKCCACGGTHRRLDECKTFSAMTVEERWETAKKSRACFRCLGSGHHARICRCGPCSECGRFHHILLHSSGSRPPVPGVPHSGHVLSPEAMPFTTRTSDQGDRAEMEPPSSSHRYIARGVDGCRSFFQTAVVEATGPKGSRKVRILLDGGSDSSYIRSSLAEELGLRVLGSGVFACVGFQERREEARTYNKVEVELKSKYSDCSLKVDLWSTDELCAPLPAAQPPNFNSELEMADDFTDGQVDVLIGIDHLYRIILWKQVELGEGVRAIETVFGYVLHGRQGQDQTDQPQRQAFHCQRVQEMWDLDTVGVVERENVNLKSSSRSVPTWNEREERYEMGLLWRSEERPVSNYHSALSRTQKMTQHLSKERFKLYDEQIKEMVRGAVVEPSVPASEHCVDKTISSEQENQSAVSSPSYSPAPHLNEESSERRNSGAGQERDQRHSSVQSAGEFFLPHHGVLRNQKLRIVFDGSAGDGTGRSLNDYLDSGDNLLAKLPSVLLNFRSGMIGCQADIQSAFHQVLVKQEDRQYLQFLWAGKSLRFARVPFGLTCSPYMLLRTVDVHLEKFYRSDAELCRLLQTGSYMDDICLSFGAKDEARAEMARTKDIFAEAKMNLHKTRMTGDEVPEASVLGLTWSTETDQLAVTVPEFPCPTTKSELLSVVSKTFDPLGMLVPWLIGGKILFQRTWKEMPDGDWDDLLEKTLQEDVESWWKSAEPRAIYFPRKLSCNGLLPETTFHVFCDASGKAYCAAVYAVTEGQSSLVVAKSRLAPVSPVLTIPRLELMAALIGARLMNFVRESLVLRDHVVSFWTDSRDVLYWIRNRKQRKVFVQNRVSSILHLTSPEQWHHVRGSENPADLGTRGITLLATEQSKLWWNGPTFLVESPQPEVPEVLLPPSAEAQGEDKVDVTVKKSVPMKVAYNTQQLESRLFDITECSSLKQVICRTAWIRRFVSNARRPRADRVTGALTPEERNEALMFWLKDAQAAAYKKELKALQSSSLLPGDSPLLKLRPRLDEHGILCAFPRTNESPLPILPEFAYITTLLIDEAHRQCFHQGTSATLAILSAEYLVRRRSVLRVVKACRRCRRYRGQSYRSADGGLPSFRVEPSRPFSKVGLDFFGPLYTDAGSKVWVLLITCGTSRAVHLELVKSQHVDDVKLALRRFFALRGTPSLIYSDNAKTFKAMLHHISRSVRWKFIPESAPWWGGFWERLVGVTKTSLKITLHLCNLSHEELAATLYELAFHLNMRPLTSVDDELLTPAHFLFGVTSIKGVLTPSRVFCDQVIRAWRHQRRVCEHLLRRWTSEYVAALRSWSVSPRGRPTRVPSVGDVVLVSGEGPRGRWPLALVTELIVGRDGKARAAYVRMNGKRTRRPLNKMFQLEAADADPK